MCEQEKDDDDDDDRKRVRGNLVGRPTSAQ
jgi:hypothetical protein